MARSKKSATANFAVSAAFDVRTPTSPRKASSVLSSIAGGRSMKKRVNESTRNLGLLWWRETAILAGVLAAGLLIPIGVGLGGLTIRDLAAVGLIATLIACVGRSLATWLGLPASTGFTRAFEVVGGAAVLGLSLLAVILVANVRVGTAVAVVMLLGGPLVWWGVRAGARERLLLGGRGAWGDAAVFLAIVLLASLWSREVMTSLRVGEKTGRLPAWSDISAHATEINYLRNFPVFERGSPFIAGHPQLFYHRASYTFPALHASLSGRSNLQVATVFWGPFGLILMGLGAYGLGCALAGRPGGATAALGLFVLPDASTYGWGNGIFSFHWLVSVSPGLAYGIAIVLTALGVLSTGQLSGRPRLLWGGGALAAVSASYKVQVAAPAAVLFGVLLFWLWRPVQRWHRPTLIVVVGVAALALMLAMEWVPLAPHFFTGSYSAGGFFDLVHGLAPPASAALYHQLVADASPITKRLVGAGVLLSAAFGALLPLWLALIAKRKDARVVWALRCIPALLIGAYLAVVFLVPTAGYDDISEFRHRPFVLVYAALVVGVAVEATLLWRGGSPRSRGVTLATATVAVAIAGGLLVVDWRTSATLQASTVPANAVQVNQPVPPAFFAATRHIRDAAGPADCVLSADCDPTGLVLAFTERRAFLSFFRQMHMLAGPIRSLVDHHLAVVQQMAGARDYEELSQLAVENRIDWLVVRSGEMSGWSADLRTKAEFSREGISVFHFPPARRVRGGG